MRNWLRWLVGLLLRTGRDSRHGSQHVPRFKDAQAVQSLAKPLWWFQIV